MIKETVLSLKDVNYRYKDAKKDEYVLRDINYGFKKGKTYAIKGRSGSGKTTLLSLISGLEKNYEGEIRYKNRSLKRMDLDNYRSKNIGIVFQSYNLLPHLTALENIVLSMDVSKVKVKDKKKLASKLVEEVGLDSSMNNRRILKLSGGEQQRIAIARSLSYNPEIILADEPTGNLDRETENEIMKIFNTLAHEQDKCIIIVTHSQNVCDSVDEVYELKKRK
ncbi:ABC transporter ATP-binding protein [Candidatus Saccharibacteria bacterium]|nr:ABC transporter ATP-binding protein [Candidatus Saccharibacteria bacterium]